MQLIGEALTFDDVSLQPAYSKVLFWQTCTAVLPLLFADVRIQADKLIEPMIHIVKLGSATLHTPEDVKAWTEKTEQESLKQLKQGPVVVN